MEIFQEFDRLWGQRLHSADLEESETTCLQDQNNVVEAKEVEREMCKSKESQNLMEVDASIIGDFPAKYPVGNLRDEEFLAVGVYIDQHIVPGFKYRVRPLQPVNGGKERWLWNGEALELESVGRGYSRRLTFSPPLGSLNSNPHYFWADSWDWGFAFQPEFVSPGDEFTVFDSSQLPVATLRVLQNQEPQREVSQRVLDDGLLEKVARIKVLVEVEWYSQDLAQPANTITMSGKAVSIRGRSGIVQTKVIGAVMGGRNYTLRPGTTLRPTVVQGAAIGDVPTTYTIVGLEPHQFPVIGTYIDPRIAVGFHYRVARIAGEKQKWIWKEPVELMSIGKGYGKRLVFLSPRDKSGENGFHLWSDSHPDGLAFEHAAVRAGANFDVYAGDLRLGSAHVFRADAPQIERKHIETPEGLLKKIHVEVTCTMVLESLKSAPETMRLSGTAVLLKEPKACKARLLRIEDVGLESKLFLDRTDELVFLPM